MHPLARWKLRSVKPYVPGKPIEEVARELGIKSQIYKLASNENPLGSSPKAKAAIIKAADSMHLYPDDSFYALKKKIASRFNVQENQILFGNGSVEIMLQLAIAFVNPGETIIAPKNTFIMYKVVGNTIGASVFEPPISEEGYVDLDIILGSMPKDTKIIFIANPNNPTGNIIPPDNIYRFMDKVGDDVIIVFDEAYYEYASFFTDFPDTMQYVKEGRNVVILRTFSKIYGLAGLRIGYGFTTPEIFEAIQKVRLPFNLNRMAQIAAIAALDDKEHVEKSLKITGEGLRFLTSEFKKMGLDYIPSYTNFIMVKFGEKTRVVYEELLKRGIVVRPLDPYGIHDALRISIGTMEENNKLVGILKEILK